LNVELNYLAWFKFGGFGVEELVEISMECKNKAFD